MATYAVPYYFQVPKDIDLDDKTQVSQYFVKWNVLNIIMANGETIEIEPVYGPEVEPELKRPISIELCNDGFLDD
jgi:hypothetical protein